VLKAYLPANYHVVHVDPNGQGVLIAGEDDHGWTLDDYVIPRFGSGLIACREVFPVFMSEDPNRGPGYCMDVPNEWMKVQMPESVFAEKQERKNANLVQLIIAHEGCDDLERNDETSWTCSLATGFFLMGQSGYNENAFDGTLEHIFYMLDSKELNREDNA
jgi:hypothetical protein